MNTTIGMRELVGYSLVKAKSKALGIKKNIQTALPSLFGMPIRGSLVQFYRNDTLFDTVLSFTNYLSYFLPDEEIAIVYSVNVHDRHGKRVASGARRVGPRQTLQVKLSEFVSGVTDEFGLFCVDASYKPRYVQSAGFLGQTSPQFMTLFIPRDPAHGPQMIHSHKHFEYLPLLKSPNTRRSAVIEILDRLRQLDLFVLNSSPSRVHGSIELRSTENDELWSSSAFEIPGHGVTKISHEIKPGARPIPRAVSCVLSLDKAIHHRKPIIFRTAIDGIVTCNHS
jgi:hypothetical protein